MFSVEEDKIIPPIKIIDLIDHIKGVPLAVKNKELLEKYVKPCMWEGTLYLDGGWSIYKNEVQRLVSGDAFKGYKLPLVLEPANDISISTSATEEIETVTENNRHYKILFAGEIYEALLHLIKAISELGVTYQNYGLISFLNTKIPEPGTPIFKLSITTVKDNIKFVIQQGKWIPSFEDIKFPTALWEE